jgi:hypothetical protein
MWKVLRGLAVMSDRPRTLSGTPSSCQRGRQYRLRPVLSTAAVAGYAHVNATPGRGFLRRDCVSGTRPFGGDIGEVPRRRTCPVGEFRFVDWFGEVSRVCLGRASGGGFRGSGIRSLHPNALGVASGAAGLRVRGRHAGLAVLAARTRGTGSGLTLGVQGARSDADVDGLRSIR